MNFETLQEFTGVRYATTPEEFQRREQARREIRAWLQTIFYNDTRDALELMIFYGATLKEACRESPDPDKTAEAVRKELETLKYGQKDNRRVQGSTRSA